MDGNFNFQASHWAPMPRAKTEVKKDEAFFH